MSIRHDLVDLILMALDNQRSPSIAQVSAAAGRRARVENGIDAILARYAVVELPEPVVTDGDVDEDDDPYEFRAPWAVYHVAGSRVESDTGPMWSPGQARREAAALLAAANRAEAQQ